MNSENTLKHFRGKINFEELKISERVGMFYEKLFALDDLRQFLKS